MFRRRFEGADCGGADDDDAPVTLPLIADGGDGRGGDGKDFSVHGMFFERMGFHRQECAEADFKVDGNAFDAHRVDFRQERRRKMQTGRRGGERFAFTRINGLISFAIGRIGGSRLFDIWRQRHTTDAGENKRRGVGRRDGDEPTAFFAGNPRLNAEVIVACGVDEFIAGLDLPAGAEHDLPLADLLFGEEQPRNDCASRLSQLKLGRNNAGVIHNKQIAGQEIFRQVVKSSMLDLACAAVNDHEATVVSRLSRPRGDAVGRKIVIKFADEHKTKKPVARSQKFE